MDTYSLVELRREVSGFTDLCDNADDVFKHGQTNVILKG